MTKKFYIIDDHESADCKKVLWDAWLYEGLPHLPSKPPGWKKCPSLPEGNWTMASESWSLLSDGAYIGAGIRKPTHDQLPVIFCVTADGVEERCRVNVEQANEFIRARI